MPHLHLCHKDPENTFGLCTDRDHMNQHLKISLLATSKAQSRKQKAIFENAFGGEAKDRKKQK